MGALIDLVGKRFGMITVISYRLNHGWDVEKALTVKGEDQ